MADEKTLEIVKFHGDELEVVELDGEGWVSFPSLLAPFGKRADNCISLLEGWAKTRVSRLTSRKGVGNPLGSDTTLVHRDDVPLAIARLDRRGMDEVMKERHTLYLRECAKVLADYFTRGAAYNPRAGSPGADMPPWARLLLEGIGGGVQAARAEAQQAATTATRAEEKADSAAAAAKEARDLANQAVLLVGSKSVLDAVSDATAPGRATETPDGAFAKRAPDGYRSMKAVAHSFALPRTGEGANVVARIAEALGIFEDPTLFFVQDVVIGGRIKNQHRMYSPRAVELLDKPLRRAFERMVASGYTTTKGGALAPTRSEVRSKKWVVDRMVDAANAAPAPSADTQGELFEKAG